MTPDEQAREIAEARTTADVMARLERVAVEAKAAIAPIVERERMGLVLVLVDPHAPPHLNAIIGGGNLTVASMREALAVYLRMLRGATYADKVAVR